MNLNEWALVLFTILTQMAVGSFLVLGVVHFFATRARGVEAADRLSDASLLAIGPVLALAMLASLGHLGNPLAAPRAVTNFMTSWLSREILFTVLFVVVGGVFAIMQWRKIGSSMVRTAIAWVAALLGIAQVYSMAMIYRQPAQPAWDTVATPISFFVTTILLGLFAVGASYVANYAYVRRSDPSCAEEQCDVLRSTLRWIAVSAIVFLGIELVVLPLYLLQLTTGPAVALESAQLLVEEYGLLLGLRVALVFVGAGILAVFLYQATTNPEQERLMVNLTYGAFALVLVAEVMGRFLFYASHVRLGV
jgi:anaerobic dimethyl sulfoxide reductase subunit C (anchor subunit)